MKTFKDLKERDIVWIIDYKDIKEYKVHYCIPYNGYYCLVIEGFGMDPFRNGEGICEEHTVRPDESIYCVYYYKNINFETKGYIILNKEDINKYQSKLLKDYRKHLYKRLKKVRNLENLYIRQIDEVENIMKFKSNG
jgi:hypothetical protein